ncbi:hypothetical protein HMPREF0628_1119 [Peptoniphilus lacrimalis 315-B]|uniref:Uncharacterized protein n=1 Tax=Peptoniphilus lacrimalis 315-B TaxID=596330 RepID=D1VU76_9FIRM|nr:hypothetical protein HMPREF0628_1119 [Peptoniphilus lacrimalis 315-B]
MQKKNINLIKIISIFKEKWTKTSQYVYNNFKVCKILKIVEV